MSSTLSFDEFVKMKKEYAAYLTSQSATAPPPTTQANTSSAAPKRQKTPEQKEKWNAYMREYKAKRKAEKRGSKPSETSTSE